MRVITLCFLAFFSSACVAADRTDKVRVLMESQGLVQMLEQQIYAGRLEGRKQAEQVLDQFMVQLKPTKEFDSRFRAALEDFLKALEPPWKAQDIVDVWAKAYGALFSDQELDELVAYYTSSLGKKDVMATQAALPEVMNHFSALSKPLIERATKDYIQRLQLISKECKCKK